MNKKVDKKVRITANIHKNDYLFIMKWIKDKEFNQSELIRKIIQDWCKFMSGDCGK